MNGEHPIDEHKSARFSKEIKVSKDCKLHDIHAKLSSGILYITMKRFPSQDRQLLLSQPSKEKDQEQGSASKLRFDHTTALKAGVVVTAVAAIAFGAYLMDICRRCNVAGN